MRSLLSEFSYGFALTHEFVKAMGSLSAAPIFPSLISEGSAGGGYDVKLERPGLPLFIQFKRSECIVLKSGREVKKGASLTPPYYRFPVTASADSDQHKMLLAWDAPPNEVFYAAPMFHTKAEFDSAFLAGQVRQRSFFVRPHKIGHFTDVKTHHVSFDGAKCYVMSEPREIEAFGIADLERLFRNKLRDEKRPLAETIQGVVESARNVREALRQLEAEIQAEILAKESESLMVERPEQGFVIETVTRALRVTSERSPVEEFLRSQLETVPPGPRPIPESDQPAGQLAELADISIRDFNAQLYIVQERASGSKED